MLSVIRIVACVCVVAALLGCDRKPVWTDKDGAVHMTVTGDPTCATCRVDVQPVASYRTSDSSIGLRGKPLMLERAPDGRALLADEKTLALFDASGTFVRTFGDSTANPGRLHKLRSVHFVSADTILVLHGISSGPAFHAYFDSAGRAISDTLHEVPAGEWRFLAPDHQVIAAPGSGANEFKATLHLVEGRRRVARSVPLDSLLQIASSGGSSYSVWNGTDGGMWIAEAAHPMARQFDSTLKPIMYVDFMQSWFSQPPAERTIDSPPPSSITGVVYDASADVLWLLGSTVAETWKQAYAAGGPLDPAAGERLTTDFPYAMLHNGILVAIDAKTAQVLATAPLRGYPMGLLAGGLVGVWDGEKVDVSRYSLVR